MMFMASLFAVFFLLASATQPGTQPRGEGGGYVKRALRSVHNIANEAVVDQLHCLVGDSVKAIYSPTGVYCDAKITSINKDGTVTVEWPDKRPYYRHLPAEDCNKDGISCSKEAPTKWGRNATREQVSEDLQHGGETVPEAPSEVVHFLFLVDDHLPHRELWEKFFADAPAGSWRAWVHCKEPDGCRDTGLDRLPGFTMVPTIPTWYCHDLVTAMAQLLSSALVAVKKSPEVRLEKFVFLSDSTLPVKPFHEVHRVLSSDDDSDFCIFPQEQWASGKFNGHEALLVKHHQWLTLNRKHAELFVRSWRPVDAEGYWPVPLKSGPWARDARVVEPQDFYHPPNSNWCTDEWAFFATVFGAVEDKVEGVQYLPSFNGGGALHLSGPVAQKTQGRCRTFAYWGNTDGPAFADLATHVHQDKDSHISCYPTCHSRPASFEKVSMKALLAMRNSEFLFARKFSEDVEVDLLEYEVAVLSH